MKRVVLLSLGLMVMSAAYIGCLPSDSGGGGNPGTGGSGPGVGGTGNTQGTAGTLGTGGTTQGTGGDGQGTGGSTQGTGGDATGTGGNPQGTGGDGSGGNPQGAGGNPQGAGGNPQGGRGGNSSTAGTGGNPRGGNGGTAGNPRGGNGGTAGTGGTAGAGGSSRGGTTGTGGNPMEVATPIDGAMLLGPCLRDTQAAVCATVNGGCPGANTADPALSGVLTTNKTITLGGDPNTTYTIVLHIQGEVESKNYNGGTDVNSSGSSPTLNGWRYPTGTTNPTPGTNNAYNVYMLRVTNPGSTAHTDYFLNSIDPPGVENHTSYGIDYTTPAAGTAGALTVKGTAKIQLVAADSNCSMIKNCGPTQNDGNTCAAPITLNNVEASSVSKNSTFDFTKPYNGQWIVLTVKSVTAN
ncbi:MAG TPA: hypothetical protein VIF57_09095 [Polyangia bacterium]